MFQNYSESRVNLSPKPGARFSKWLRTKSATKKGIVKRSLRRNSRSGTLVNRQLVCVGEWWAAAYLFFFVRVVDGFYIPGIYFLRGRSGVKATSSGGPHFVGVNIKNNSHFSIVKNPRGRDS